MSCNAACSLRQRPLVMHCVATSIPLIPVGRTPCHSLLGIKWAARRSLPLSCMLHARCCRPQLLTDARWLICVAAMLRTRGCAPCGAARELPGPAACDR